MNIGEHAYHAKGSERRLCWGEGGRVGEIGEWSRVQR